MHCPWLAIASNSASCLRGALRFWSWNLTVGQKHWSILYGQSFNVLIGLHLTSPVFWPHFLYQWMEPRSGSWPCKIMAMACGGLDWLPFCAFQLGRNLNWCCCKELAVFSPFALMNSSFTWTNHPEELWKCSVRCVGHSSLDHYLSEISSVTSHHISSISGEWSSFPAVY